jgi:hypothetical protein
VDRAGEPRAGHYPSCLLTPRWCHAIRPLLPAPAALSEGQAAPSNPVRRLPVRTHLFFCPLACLLLSASSAPADQLSKMWRLAELPPQEGWGSYRGADTWPGVLGGKKEYRLALGRPLPRAATASRSGP